MVAVGSGTMYGQSCACLSECCAFAQACKYITETLAVNAEQLGKDALINCAKTAMSSKIIGAESDFFAALAVEAMQSVKTTASDGTVRASLLT